MERDFEQEFRELKQNEIPDLWNRIEAGLSEKKSVTSAPKKVFAWRKWGTLIAACVCVVIILPAFSLLIRNKSYSGSDTSSSAVTEGIAYDTTAMESTADTAMVTEATAEDAEAEEGVTEAAAEDVAAAAEEPTDTMATDADGMTGNASTADAGGYDAAASTNNAAVPDSSENIAPEASAENTQIQKSDEEKEAESEEEKAVLGLMDGQVLEAVVIEIQNVETAGGETACQAVVLQADADDILEDGMQITIVCDDETTYDFPRGPREDKELKEQETYRVTLRYDAEEERLVVLTAGGI